MSQEQPSEVFAAGDVIDGRYRIVRRVGKGGMGEVYEAEDLEAERRVALKTVLPELLSNTKTLTRFQREIEFSQRVSHPNVLKIHGVFQTHRVVDVEGRGREQLVAPCLLMELLLGETVADLLQAGRTLTPEEARPLACQMAAGLAAAHRAGVIHRDLKPDNIFLVPQEGGTRVVLTDFGVARERDNKVTREESLTASNVILGTAEYMAPEQLELEEASPASDIYTLGLVLFEMLTGRQPFEAETPLKVVFKRVQEDPPSPRRYLPDLDPSWEQVILRCLQRKKEDRFPTADGIIELLDGGDSAWLHKGEGSGQKWTTALLVALAILAVAIVVTLASR